MPGAYNASACQAYFFNRSETTEAAARTEESALNSSCFYPVKQVAGGGASACLRTRVSLIPFPGAPRVLFRATLLYRTLLPIDPSNRSQLCLRLLLSLIARGPQRVLVNA